ncbi:glycoside hydrolase family 2 protein [Spirochaeta isovalerica]|uniref:Beta-galactosidase n=1 Tax=Spirochaeta isovalerica TaxID=150 RepID=A0A841RAK2_9SPIO|nr:sugar-binding domain-containing protein [Spirochaeta isovalerica]MBB6479949.1 beta-galactosidase [Spirochaeta isovalerica]
MVKKVYNRKFAPQEGLVKSMEKPRRDEICLNGFWRFQPVAHVEEMEKSALISPTIPESFSWESTMLKVPSPWNVNGFLLDGGGGDFRSFPSYPESWNTVKAGWLNRTVTVPADWSGSRILLHFEAVAGYVKVFVNGEEVAEHFDPTLPFAIDVTAQAAAGGDLDILLWIVQGELLNEPGDYGSRVYVGGSFWASYIAGIWQDVFLQKMPVLYISDVFVKPLVNRNRLEIDVTVKNTTETERSFNLKAAVAPWLNQNGSSSEEVPEVNWCLGEELFSFNGGAETIPAHSEKTITIGTSVDGRLSFWSPEDPQLYGLLLYAEESGTVHDGKYTRFGWRQFSIKGRKFLLNGKQIRLKADSWHFTGIPQMTRRYAWAWYKMVQQSNGNAVRLHAQVYPRFYLELADEMGMCILDESAIWFSDAASKMDSDKLWAACSAHVKGLVLRDRNYPSVLGWSVCNETVEVGRMVFHAPKSVIERNIAEIRNWISIARKNDPTRDWISGDGEIFGRIGLPTFIEHYAWRGLYPLFSLLGKPWGTGETGMAYFGTPRQVSKVNGDRAYESQLGRMEGLAGEAFDLITSQRKAGSSYASVFNLAWYGNKPLPLGLEDTSRAYELSDGIFFSDFEEGLPGVQPERLGPYCTTFNPGYDGDLPLNEEWPLLQAVKAAFSDDFRKRKNIWKPKSRSEKHNRVSIARAERKQSVTYLSSADGSTGKTLFENVSVTFSSFDPDRNQLVIIDGKHPPLLDGDLEKDLRKAVEGGSTILLWGADSPSTPIISSLTGRRVDFADRAATSYLVAEKHPLVRNLGNRDLYFSEIVENTVSARSMTGDWPDNGGRTILKACDTDWKAWNYQAEPVKTAKVLRSERESKPAGNIIVQQPIGQGEIIVSTLDFFDLGMRFRSMVASILKNLGASLNGRVKTLPPALNRRRVVTHVLYNDGKGHQSVISRGWGSSLNLPSAPEGLLSFRIHSPRSLDDLLIEPGLPRLDMKIRGRGITGIALNGVAVSHEGDLALSQTDEGLVRGLSLRKGWNRIVFKTTGGRVKISFSCTKKAFLRKMRSVVDLPERGDE